MMNKHFLTCTLFLVFFLLPFSLAAKDLGLLLDQSSSYESSGNEAELKYFGTLIPWFSSSIGDAADLYISAGVTAGYEYKELQIVPELLRTELTFLTGENGELRIGRINYTDPLGFIANGLFDGVHYSIELGEGPVLGMGVWYTGLLYKKNAYITMTEFDLEEYNTLVDYADFSGTYFAPRRLVAAIDWEHPGIAELVRLRLALIGQFDLSGRDTLYHTQYLTAKLSIPVNDFVYEVGGIAELAQASKEYSVSFAGELGIAWEL